MINLDILNNIMFLQSQMKRCWIFCFLVILSIGCSKLPPSKPPPIVVLNGWWNIDYAKTACERANKWHQETAELIQKIGCANVTSCQELMPIIEACANGVVEEVRNFETNLATEFAVNTGCLSVQFVYFSGPDNKSKEVSDAMGKEHYLLMFDYKPGASKQHWTLQSSDNSSFTQGEGNPEEIAKKICFIVREQGAKLTN